MEIKAGVLLKEINNPDDLKKLSREQLHQVCDELRQYIIDVVSVYGGHFGASLGVVELSVALHYVFNTPYDQLVWDVGHQAYGHKIQLVAGTIFLPTENTTGLAAFPSAAKASTIHLALVTLPPPFLQHWVWPWHRITKERTTASMLPLLETVL